MPVLAGRTRVQLRAAVLYNCGALYEGTASATGSTTTLVDSNVPLGATDDFKGCWIEFTGGLNDGAGTLRVSSSSTSGGITTFTFAPAVSNATASGDTYQLIGKSGFYPTPAMVNGFLNQAMIEVMGLAYDPEESVALHGDTRQRRFDLPTEFKHLFRVETRRYMEYVDIDRADQVWSEAAVPVNVTRSQDTQDYKLGASLKFDVAAGFSTGLLSSKAIGSLNISKYDYVEFWIKSTVATAAGDLRVILDDTANCASATETLNVPALTADTWTYCRVALSNPESDTAIISVGLRYHVDIGACSIWINDIKAVKEETSVWVPVDKNAWYVDEEARDLVFRAAPPYRLIKLIGGDSPALFTTDSDTAEIDEQYLIARATELTLLALSGGPANDPDALRSLAGYWGRRADEAKHALPFITGRTVS